MDSENNIYDIDYIIVTGRDHNELENIVRKQIRNGYEPIGGVTINTEKYSIDDNKYNTAYMITERTKFYQSMIKKIKKKKLKKK